MVTGPLDPGLLAALGDAVGAANVLTSPDLMAGYSVDWTGRFAGAASAVVRPATTEEVAAVVRLARSHGVALVPQGGNTGLVGGSVPLAGEVVVSLRRLGGAQDVDGLAGQVTGGAGVTLADVHSAAAAAGWAYGVDFGSRDSATVGGMVATNAGGVRVLRHGATRAQVLGVEAVLGDGSVVSHLGGLVKDNTGYDLAALLCGSEGTLGIVTRARLRLVPRTDSRVVALLAFASSDAAVRAAAALRAVPSLDAAEVFFAAGLELVCSVFNLPRPFADGHAAYVLAECASTSDPTADLAAAVDGLDAVEDAAVAGPAEPGRRATLWRYREAHTEAINTLGAPHKLDVTLPVGALPEFANAVGSAVAAVAPDAACWLFGHAADGNLHVNVTGVAADDDRVDDAVLRLVARFGGSSSAEHGIGTAKKRWLHLNRTDAEIAAMRRIKAALDPDGILNPNVLLP